MSDIFEQLDQPVAEAWRSQEGDAIAGTVIGIDSRDGGYGEYPIITVEVDPGSSQEGQSIELPAKRAVHAMATVLKSELGWSRDVGRWENQKVQLGDRIGIKDQGKQEGRNGSYQLYKVVVQSVDVKLEDPPTEPDIFSSDT